MNVDLWICGFVDLWICGFVELWSCGVVSRVIEKNRVTFTIKIN